MTQHLVIDILSTGEEKECGILKIAAVSFDPTEDILTGRNYFAANISRNSLYKRDYSFPKSFVSFTLGTEDYKILEYLSQNKEPINSSIHNFVNYMLGIHILAAGNVKAYFLDEYKLNILLYTLAKEGYPYPESLSKVGLLTDNSYVDIVSTIHKFDVLDRVNTVAALLYGNLMSKLILAVNNSEFSNVLHTIKE